MRKLTFLALLLISMTAYTHKVSAATIPILEDNKLEPIVLVKPEEPPEPKPPELTLEEKIKTNHYKCNTDVEYIRADNARCLAKPGNIAVQSQKLVKRARNGSNTYEPGQCVWFIKNMRPELPNTWGSAYQWLANAQADGWPTGSTPAVGAVGVSGNHVVLITSVNGNGTVSYTDMNGRWIPFEIGYGTKPASYYTYIY